MADHNGERMALADVYAESLLQVARERHEDEDIAREFADLVDYVERNPDFERFLMAASVDDDPRRASLERLFRGRMSDLLLNLLQVLNNRGRMSLLRAVERCVELRMERKHQQKEVIVEAAMPLTEALRSLVRQTLGEWLQKEVLLVEKVDPDLVGGVVIRYDDIQVDASVASQIRLTYRRLKDRITHEIHGGAGYVE